MYEVKKICETLYEVRKNGSLLQTFGGDWASNDAHDYAQELAEDKNWNASNRD